ncbi:hypothetical protein JOF28_000494 [Leucobacter exalbidus]|uniref:DUF2304 domain-containing protein n=1 Tax=Leucobacter exalbidus TaxID=662960 RepID=A0A940T2N4_9MICO|nr:DUF2304 domain-containing protein [Leucobacter exalbidus]MBP1325262.1 hypothetical protein [Leucobacter exalbidus]
MSPDLQNSAVVIFGTVLALAMVIIILVLLSKRQLGEKYAVLWLLIGIGGLIVVAVPGLLDQLTRALHVQLPSNLLFGGAILLLVGVALHLSWELSRAEDEVRRLAEDSAINDLEITKLARRVAQLEAQASGQRDETSSGTPDTATAAE